MTTVGETAYVKYVYLKCPSSVSNYMSESCVDNP